MTETNQVFNREIIKHYTHAILNVVANCIQYNDSDNWDNAFCMKEISEIYSGFSNAIIIEPNKLSAEELCDLGFRKWNNNMFLIPMYLWNNIPDGTELFCIDDMWHTKGVNTEKLPDTRFGMTAYGVNTVTYDNYE